MPVPPVVVPRWVQLVILPLALLALWALARAAGVVVLILLGASTGALILNPLVKMMHRRGVPRGIAIPLVYIGIFAILVGIGVLLADPVSTQVGRVADNLPHYTDVANRDLADLQRFFDKHGIKIHIEKQGQSALTTLEKSLLKRSSDILSFSRGLATQFVTMSFDLILTFVLSIYLLIYANRSTALCGGSCLPATARPRTTTRCSSSSAVFGYVRGQLLFSVIMGASAALGLWIFGALRDLPVGQSSRSSSAPSTG